MSPSMYAEKAANGALIVENPTLQSWDAVQTIPLTLIQRTSVVEKPAATAKLAARDLNLWYGHFQALKNVSMSIPKNEITALIGPSGCGKSTFLRVFNRMNDLIPGVRMSGSVELDGTAIYGRQDPVEIRKRVGMVFQRPNPFPKTIFDNVVYGPRLHGERNKARLQEIAETSLRQAFLWEEVKDKLQSPALALSGGQQQRVCIARCLAVKPEVILLDEPTSALDPNATYRIEQLLSQLRKDYTVVIVTHNMQQASRISDWTGFFLMGEMVEFGRTRDIFENPADHRTSDYVSGRFG